MRWHFMIVATSYVLSLSLIFGTTCVAFQFDDASIITAKRKGTRINSFDSSKQIAVAAAVAAWRKIPSSRIRCHLAVALSQSSSSSSSSSPEEEEEEDEKQERPTTTTPSNTIISTLNAALLIAGTTVGGGFLALPTVVSPTGFVPSVTALICVWVYFLVESFCIVECLLNTRRHQQRPRRCQPEKDHIHDNKSSSSEDNDSKIHLYHPVGIAAAAKSTLGVPGEIVVVILLATLIEATLVSQISRAGALFPSYRFGCCTVALGMAGLVFPKKMQTTVPTVNSILTIVFCIMAVILFRVGAPIANWSNLALSSSSAAVATNTGIAAAWLRLPHAIPTFLQLLVYAEILPTVCQLLHYNPRLIRVAISLGSLLPLGLEIGWAALGIALVPPPSPLLSSSLSLSSSQSGAAAAAAVHDPVNILLKSGGPVQTPLLTLAITAIATTIIGCYLALQSMIDDVFPMSSPPSRNKNNNTEPLHGGQNHHHDQLRRRIWTVTAIVAPALTIASISPNLFLQAIDFAGSYPVLLLWGVAPPVICLLQRRQQRTRQQQETSRHQQHSPQFLLPIGWLWGTTIVSLGLFTMSTAPDLAFLIKRML